MSMASLIMLIPKEDHVTRFHSKLHYDSGTEEVLSEAFKLRENEDYVSCAWVEHHNNKQEDDEKRDITRILSKGKPYPNGIRPGAYSTLKVETIYNIAQNINEEIKVTHEPSEGALSHAGIYHSNNFRLLRNLAREATKHCKKYP